MNTPDVPRPSPTSLVLVVWIIVMWLLHINGVDFGFSAAHAIATGPPASQTDLLYCLLFEGLAFGLAVCFVLMRNTVAQVMGWLCILTQLVGLPILFR